MIELINLVLDNTATVTRYMQLRQRSELSEISDDIDLPNNNAFSNY